MSEDERVGLKAQDVDGAAGYGAVTVDDVDTPVDVTSSAVAARGLRFTYKGGDDVLCDLNMSVPRGRVYALLGPSGCGKSTLLRCVLGQLCPSNGQIRVLGAAPGTRGCSVPGPAVGYMPQDTALEEELTVAEVFRFYGRLYGMADERVNERATWLMNFLNLPLRKRRSLVKTLSGGQKRRLSLCVALLHEPRLLILDEPTVGVDPVLRTKIWGLLMQLCRESDVTVVVTTHYIQEASSAHRVGLMREGRLLAEHSPEALVAASGEAHLEAVFLRLCRHQDRASDPLPATLAQLTDGSDGREAAGGGKLGDVPGPPSSGKGGAAASTCCRRSIVGAIVYRGMRRLQHNPGFLAFQFLLPAIQMTLFCIAIGAPPEHLAFGVVNHDVGVGGSGASSIHLADRFVANLNVNSTSDGSFGTVGSQTFDVTEFDDIGDAVSAVRAGKSWGVLSFGSNYTSDVLKRYSPGGAPPSPSVVAGGTANLTMDMSDEQIAVTINTAVLQAYQKTMKDLIDEVMPSMASLASPPINELPPVYGERNPSFTSFVAPGIMVSISFGQSIGLTAIAFVLDKKRGTLERLWATGMKPAEVLLGSLISQVVVLVVQMLCLLFVALVVFDVPHVGPVYAVLLVVTLLGIGGMSFGLCISAFVSEVEEAMQASLGSFFPVFLLSGIIWPIEGMPTWLYYVSQSMPTTWAARTLRSILIRGWGLDDVHILTGAAVIAAWVIALLAAAAALLYRKR